MQKHVASFPQRLDIFLSSQDKNLSRAKAQKLIKYGKVEVNEKIVTKVAFMLKEGDKVTVSEIDAMPLNSKDMESVDLHLDVIYEDEACLIINKPAGFAVHPAGSMHKDEQTILHGIAFLFEERRIPFTPDGVLVHRLDKETTGCLLIAKNTEAHAVLQKQFENRTIYKKYLAIVAGAPQPPSATIDAPIGRNLVHRTMMSIFKTSKSREAKTTYRTLEAKDDVALLECDLHTGRTHQIRVHLSSIGHPILGDSKYNSSLSREVSEEYKIEGLCLHAWKLEFDSPEDNGRVKVASQFSSLFENSLEHVGLNIGSASV
ncbi:RluA family pseudouridine synthase [Patescibacteria group bacterium]|nr:RluA family pseudouridine synthase [Patescibacteria group bacterium]